MYIILCISHISYECINTLIYYMNIYVFRYLKDCGMHRCVRSFTCGPTQVPAKIFEKFMAKLELKDKFI